MHKSYDDLRNKPEWISCNVQAITNTVQKRAEARFGLPFENEKEAYATPKNGGDLTKLESAGIPGVGDKIEGAAPAGGASEGAGGVGAGPVGPQGGNSGANAGVGGSVDSDDFGRALAATRGEHVGSAAGANAGVDGQTGSATGASANSAASPQGEEQVDSTTGANAGVGVSSQGGKLAAPYKLTRISALQK
uniref:Uncharacterized protein n=1 Tax=Acrobeloides nanus TaxID=290746 RepID=A0A914CUA5_9BILA